MKLVVRRFGFVVGAVIVLAGLVYAQSVHFVKGPEATDLGVTLALSGKIAGLGNGDVTIILDANGIASVECTNPGGNVAPGQDTAVSTSGSATFPSPKNGNLVFTVVTLAPTVPNTPTCPNPQWTAGVTDVVFSSGTVTVVQGGAVVLQQSF